MRSPIEAPTAQLTERQREILAFVNEHSAQHGYPPTVREIGTAVGLTSSSTVHAHLANLERLGLMRRDPAKPRALNLAGREQKAPAYEWIDSTDLGTMHTGCRANAAAIFRLGTGSPTRAPARRVDRSGT